MNYTIENVGTGVKFQVKNSSGIVSQLKLWDGGKLFGPAADGTFKTRADARRYAKLRAQQDGGSYSVEQIGKHYRKPQRELSYRVECVARHPYNGKWGVPYFISGPLELRQQARDFVARQKELNRVAGCVSKYKYRIIEQQAI